VSHVADITGVILAGGRSERFGKNKAFATFQGVPLIERALRVMTALFREVMIVTNSPAEYPPYGVLVLTDQEPHQGPLGGLVTALSASTNDAVFAVGCDMPILDPSVIAKIVEQGRGFDAAIPVHDGIREYLMALYSRRLLGRMSCCLSEGKLSLDEFCQKLSNVAWIPVDGDSWFNVNTKKDLEFLEKHHAD
jgi:molybdopterin-guanine dinucleotide biosynthesis protein A